MGVSKEEQMEGRKIKELRRDERHNGFIVKKWIENRDRVFGLGGERLSDLPPMNRKAKGESRPALTESAMKFISDPDNYRCLQVIEPLIQRVKEQDRRFSPRTSNIIRREVDIYALFCKCGYATDDHSFLRSIQDPKTEDEHLLKAAWDSSCTSLGINVTKILLAMNAPDDNGNFRLHVRLRVEDQAVDSPVQARNRDNNEKASKKAQSRYKELDEAIQRIMDYNECDFPEAITIYRNRLEMHKKPDVSPATIYRARAFCQGKPEGYGAATWEYEQWMKKSAS